MIEKLYETATSRRFGCCSHFDTNDGYIICFVFIVGQFLHSSQTDINQTSDPNRCECDPSIAPDTPINTPERLIYRLLPLTGWSV